MKKECLILRSDSAHSSVSLLLLTLPRLTTTPNDVVLLLSASRADSVRIEQHTLRSAAEIDLLQLGTRCYDRSAIVFVFTRPHRGRDFDGRLAAFEYGLVALHFDFVFAGLQLCATNR